MRGSPSAGNWAASAWFVACSKIFMAVPRDEALMVHYGAPNDGAAIVAERLAGARLPAPLGINIVETHTGVPINDPGLVKWIKRGLSVLLQRNGFLHVSDAVGTTIH